jgi:hypothetical protein
LDVDNSLGTKTLLVLGGIDTATNKARITENYGINTTRIKTDLENSLNAIRTSNGSALSTYMSTYMPSSSELTRKLD